MTANELVNVFDTYAEPNDWGKQAQAMLQYQQIEIDRLTMLSDAMTNECNRLYRIIELNGTLK